MKIMCVDEDAFLRADCQFVTRPSGELRQALDINYNGQKVTSAGTEIATMRISSGRPMRQ